MTLWGQYDVDDGIAASLDDISDDVPHVTFVHWAIASVLHLHIRKMQITCPHIMQKNSLYTPSQLLGLDKSCDFGCSLAKK